MLSLYSFSLSLPQLSLISNNNPTPLRSLRLPHGETHFSKKTISCTVHAVEKDSQQFEIDPDKAREALKKLDQQLQDLSKKQVTPPKLKGKNFNFSLNFCFVR